MHTPIRPTDAWWGTVRGLCRLVHFSDVLLLKINSHHPGMMKRSIVILVAKIILKVLPSKWYQGVPQDVHIHHAIDVPNQEHKGWFSTLLECAPDMDKIPSSLDPGSLAVLPEAFFRQSTNPFVLSLGGAGHDWQSPRSSPGSCEHSCLWLEVGC